mmetsp:Transcript_12759/g.50952  ORF Transcript_12759/g.50952 Transcript_12759/m.50952 type:complete len:288 (+) Transcript_12759:1538-2401(+)
MERTHDGEGALVEGAPEQHHKGAAAGGGAGRRGPGVECVAVGEDGAGVEQRRLLAGGDDSAAALGLLHGAARRRGLDRRQRQAVPLQRQHQRADRPLACPRQLRHQHRQHWPARVDGLCRGRAQDLGGHRRRALAGWQPQRALRQGAHHLLRRILHVDWLARQKHDRLGRRGHGTSAGDYGPQGCGVGCGAVHGQRVDGGGQDDHRLRSRGAAAVGHGHQAAREPAQEQQGADRLARDRPRNPRVGHARPAARRLEGHLHQPCRRPQALRGPQAHFPQRQQGPHGVA